MKFIELIFYICVCKHQTGPYDKDEIYDPRPTERPYPTRPTNRPDYSRPDHRPDTRDNILQKYKTAVGDNTKLSCLFENRNERTSWRRQDGKPLPTNAQLSGGDLVKFIKNINV